MCAYCVRPVYRGQSCVLGFPQTDHLVAIAQSHAHTAGDGGQHMAIRRRAARSTARRRPIHALWSLVAAPLVLALAARAIRDEKTLMMQRSFSSSPGS